MATKTKGSDPPTESIGSGAAHALAAALEKAGLRFPRIVGGPSTVSSDGSTAFTVIVNVPRPAAAPSVPAKPEPPLADIARRFLSTMDRAAWERLSPEQIEALGDLDEALSENPRPIWERWR